MISVVKIDHGIKKIVIIKLTIIFLSLFFGTLFGQTATPFFKNGVYDPNIVTPEEVIGFPIGERPVRYDEAVSYFRTLSETTPRVHLVESGQTHEERPLFYAIISSNENMARLANIKTEISKLADPRTIQSDAEARDIIGTSPAVAWLMYSIHGDELSGTDASLQLAYQLAAGSDSLTEEIRRRLVVGIYPMENPDGRERYLAQMQQWNGQIPNSDRQSIQHRGLWPGGRTNHYLFDLNRDWFILSQPETKARVKAIHEWNPQLIVDAHEMGSYSTYLFNPPREPINPNFSKIQKKWMMVFSDDQSAAFDEYGWSYYTREWLEDWYPGYGSSYPYLIGAVGFLYEQASTDGTLIKRPDGTILTFREAVHHQFVASIANLATAATHRADLLKDFHRMKKQALAAAGKAKIKAYYIVPKHNPSRVHRFVEKLLLQGIEVKIAEKTFRTDGVRNYVNPQPLSIQLPEGTFIIPMDQPDQPLIKAILEFDPRMKTEFLKSERESLQKGTGTRLYEVSAWSMLMAYDLEAYASPQSPTVATRQIKELPQLSGQVVNPNPKYGYIIDYHNDKAVGALLTLLRAGYNVRAAQKPIRIEGRDYPRGTLLLRANENPSTMSSFIQHLSDSLGVMIYGVTTARSQKGPDLGGGEFELLVPPRIAVIAGSSISPYSFGSIWHWLDYEWKYRFTILNHHRFGRADLRKYNVLILPSVWGGPSTYRDIFQESGLKKLKDWVADGGTLIGIGTAAAFLADSTTGLSKVKLRCQVLKDLDQYRRAVKREQQLDNIRVDSLAIWEGTKTDESDILTNDQKSPDIETLKFIDEHQRLYQPRGAILKVNLDEEHWLSYGLTEHVPAIYYANYAYMSKSPVQTAGRFSEASSIRLSGLMWSEAKQRWENTAYVTRESYQKGQIILIAGEPIFRSYFYGTGRILLNSIFLGPGFGTQTVVPW